MMEDIPLDLRHHTVKKKLKFPDGWFMTEERREQLKAIRAETAIRSKERREKGHSIVDGKQLVQGHFGSPSAYEVEHYVPQMAKKYVRPRGGRISAR
jgi:small subunit ribosomal protein S35